MPTGFLAGSAAQAAWVMIEAASRRMVPVNLMCRVDFTSVVVLFVGSEYGEESGVV
jgi:hypothetical protein